MPIYVFSCCGKKVEVVQGIDKDTPSCPDCGAKMEKLPTSPALIRVEGKTVLSKGYKEGYTKEYAKDVPPPFERSN